MSDQIPTRAEALYMLESPAFDATSEDFVDVVVAVFSAYANGRLIDRQDGAGRIAAERQRQVEVEGWNPDHDAQHDSGELVLAAMNYAVVAIDLVNDSDDLSLQFGAIPAEWPWNSEWWKPSDDPIRNLEKAGALIAAEIDRLAAVVEEQ